MSTTTLTQRPLESGFSGSLQPFPFIDPDGLFAKKKAKSRVKHLVVASIASVTAMCLLAVVIFHGYVAWMLAYPYVAPLTSNPKAAIGLEYEDVVFPSHSGQTTVSGWFVPAGGSEIGTAGESDAASTRTVVFSHGYGANREETWVPMYDLSKLLNGLGYNVLLFDYGYASKEYKAPATGGLEESQQLIAAIDYAKSRGAEDIVVWGFSMGAGTALQTAMQTDEIDAMILDSMFVPSPEALFDNLNQFVELPRFPSLPLIESLIPLWTGSSFGSIPAEEVVSNDYEMPIYVIHGTNDVKADYETAEVVASVQGNPLSRSWIVPDGQHEMLFQVHPREYIQRAALFLSQVDGQLQADKA